MHQACRLRIKTASNCTRRASTPEMEPEKLMEEWWESHCSQRDKLKDGLKTKQHQEKRYRLLGVMEVNPGGQEAQIISKARNIRWIRSCLMRLLEILEPSQSQMVKFWMSCSVNRIWQESSNPATHPGPKAWPAIKSDIFKGLFWTWIHSSVPCRASIRDPTKMKLC